MEARRQAEVETDTLIRCSGVAVAAAVGGDNGTHSDTYLIEDMTPTLTSRSGLCTPACTPQKPQPQPWGKGLLG
jgi:hypothetical protein